MAKTKSELKTLSVVLRILLAILTIVIIVWLATLAYSFSYDVFADLPYSDTTGYTTEATIRISDGASGSEIGNMLESAGIVESGSIFKYQLILEEKSSDVQPGTYKLSSDMTPTEIMSVITAVPEEDEEDTTTDSVTAGSTDALESSLSQD